MRAWFLGVVPLDAPPRSDAQEITDKGSINRRAVLRRRAALVARLYGNAIDSDPDLIRVKKGTTPS